MSFVSGETLIEFAIRLGVDDLQRDSKLIERLFWSNKLLNLGQVLTPEGSTEEVREPLVMDIFQRRLASIPRKKGEEDGEIFKNHVQSLEAIGEMINNLRVRLIHGFPRDNQDLPCISITLGTDDEQQFLGQIKGEIISGDKTFLLAGANWRTTYFVNITTTNYDELCVWQKIITYALTAWRPHIMAYGLNEISLNWMDIEPAAEYLQAGLFAYQRTLAISCTRDEELPVSKDGFSSLIFNNLEDGFDIGGL